MNSKKTECSYCGRNGLHFNMTMCNDCSEVIINHEKEGVSV